MEFGPYDMMLDFALMSILLFVAKYLRTKIKIIQNLFLPSSLIAGFLGLFLGEQFLDIIPFSARISEYAYLLVVVLFASLFLGNSEKVSFKKIANKSGNTFLLNLAAEVGGFGMALLFGGIIISRLFPDVNPAFPLMLPAGFTGGHGYAAAIGGTLKEVAGWEEALSIGQTFATIGLLTGVLGGLILINYATRKKATRFITTMAELPESMQTGLIPKQERISIGEGTIHPMSMDVLTWHILLVLFATAVGYYAAQAFNSKFTDISLPLMSVTMIAGVILQTLLNKIGLGEYVDKDIVTRIGSSITDYLVSFGVATISISVVLEYAWPLIIMTLIGIIFPIFFVFVIGKKFFTNFWFERSIFVYGWITGVVAMGITLLRIVDPEFKSGALEDYGIAYVPISFLELLLVSMLPIVVAKGYVASSGVVLILMCILLIGISWKVYGIFKGDSSELRDKEAEIINS